jgi:hypothetical protein
MSIATGSVPIPMTGTSTVTRRGCTAMSIRMKTDTTRTTTSAAIN